MQVDNQEYLKRQTDLIKKIINLDESQSLEDIFKEATSIISEGWIIERALSVQIEFNKSTCESTDFKLFKKEIKAKTEVKPEEHSLFINLFSDVSFNEVEKQLAEVIASLLGSKAERILWQKNQREEQDLIDRAYKLANIGTWEYDMINDILTWSDVTKDVHGFGPDYEPDVESTVNLFKEGYHRSEFAEAADNAINNKKPFDIELKIISGKGDERWIRAIGVPDYRDGVCERFYGISQNVTSRRLAQEEVELNDRRFKAMVRHGMDMIAILDEEANYKFVSPTSENVLGLSPEFFLDKNAFDFIHEDDTDEIAKQFKSIPKMTSVQLKPFRFMDSEYNWRWLEATVTNLTEDPAVQGYVSNSRDVTERQLKLDQVIHSLKEKETLLAEIHHRIKNNLTVLIGLLELQAAKENNDEVITRLFDSVARIQTMASIHEQLYQTNNFASIEFGERIKLLSLSIQKTFKSDANIELAIKSDTMDISINQALTCSLIANEVLTNIYKHAFTEQDKGVIRIDLKRIDKQAAELIIADNGKGLPQNFNPQKSKSLGLRLIDMLAEQLKSTYEFQSDKNGTTFKLRFKIEE